MGSGGSGVSHASSFDVDQNQLSAFMNTESGKKFSGIYSPVNSYAKIGDSIQSYDPSKVKPDQLGMYTQVGTQVNEMISAFNEWVSGNQQTKTNWDTYAATVNANKGGEGDNTITTGAAVSQRQALLGSLANIGQPTTPTPGLGSMGTLMQNGKPVGGAK